MVGNYKRAEQTTTSESILQKAMKKDQEVWYTSKIIYSHILPYSLHLLMLTALDTFIMQTERFKQYL